MSAPMIVLKPAANDNAGERPIVRTPARRPGAAYARSTNVLLPLRFARRMPEWSAKTPPAPVSTPS